MSSHVYLLVEADPGTARSIAEACRSTPMSGATVESVSVVTGPYDVIIHAVIDDITALSALINDVLHSFPGVRNTVTCIELDG